MTSVVQTYQPVTTGLAELAAALAAAQGEFEPIPKDELNPHFKSKYSSLDSAVHTNKAIMAKHGLAVSQLPGFDSEGDTLTTRLFHKSGQSISGVMRLHPIKSDPQGLASAITYARRQAFLAITGMTPGDDTDAEPQSRPRSAPPRQQMRPPPEADTETGEIAPYRRREPPHPVIPEGHTPALTAKMRLLEELANRGISEDAAKGTAKAMWGDRGSNPIPDQDLAEMIESLGPVQLFDDERPFDE